MSKKHCKRGNTMKNIAWWGRVVTAAVFSMMTAVSAVSAQEPDPVAAELSGNRPAEAIGQASLQLADGRWLMIGGSSASADLHIVNADNGAVTPLPIRLNQPRSGHSATMLPDGSIFVYGGKSPAGAVLDVAERIAPGLDSVSVLGTVGLLPRTGHTGTLLADGRVLIVGGTGADGHPILDAEVYNPVSRETERFNASIDSPRIRQIAALLPNKSVVLWGGTDARGQARRDGDIYDSSVQRFESATQDTVQKLAKALNGDFAPSIEESDPVQKAVNVAVDQRLTVRFSKRMAVDTLSTKTITLIGPNGETAIRPVAVEGGVLMFVTPERDLSPASSYTLFISGATDEQARPLPFTAIGFTTQVMGSSSGATGSSGAGTTGGGSAGGGGAGSGSSPNRGGSTGVPSAPVSGSLLGTLSQILAPYAGTSQEGAVDSLIGDDGESWIPSAANYLGNWTSGGRHYGENHLPARSAVRNAVYGNPVVAKLTLTPQTIANGILKRAKLAAHAVSADTGTTAVSGQVLKLNGKPLVGAALSIGAVAAVTDANGEFQLAKVASGHQVLVIDGSSADHDNHHYGRYEYGLDVVAGQNNALPFIIWMTRLDTRDAINIGAPTQGPTVLTNPSIPGLELRIPSGTVIRDAAGKVVTQISMTAIPTDQAPFPIPNLAVPTYFTIQPGGAHLEASNGNVSSGAQLIYPNFSQSPAGTRISFWNYDPLSKGWYVYGQGTVTADGKQVVPDPGVVIYEFTGAMVSGPGGAPGFGPGHGGKTGDPVDSATGLYTLDETDLQIPDVIPITISRSYRQLDGASRAFGTGTNLAYDFFMVGDMNPYTYQDLILPDGSRIHFPRVSYGTGWQDAVYQNTATPGEYFGAVLKYTGSADCYWAMTLKDQSQYCFAEEAGNTNPRLGAVRKIIDPRGNVLSFTRDSFGNLTGITSPNGRHVNLTYDAQNRVSQVTDDANRTIKYAYNGPKCPGCLYTVTDQAGNTEQYSYDSSGDLLTITDKRNNVYLQNKYDANGRVYQQIMAPGSSDQTVASWTYSTDANGNITQTVHTDPLGNIQQFTFNESGFLTQETLAKGTPLEQSLSFAVDPATNLLQSSTDALGRVTKYSYDALGNMASITKLYGTANAATTLFQYNQMYSVPTLVTNALGKQYQLKYDSSGNLVGLIDPLNHMTSYSYDAQGRLTGVTDANGDSASFTWFAADMAAISDALGRTTFLDHDIVGRVIGMTDPLGGHQTYGYNAMNQLTSKTDANGSLIQFGYDQNGNLTSHTDARTNKTLVTYDTLNRVKTKADALGNSESFVYQADGQLKQHTDRKSQSTSISYDALERPATYTYNDGSTIQVTFDAGNRLTKVVDSASGTIVRAFDGLDDLTQSTTSQGTIGYSYDLLGRRSTMTVPGQTSLTYNWDDANRLASISQGSTVLESSTYDSGNRRLTKTLPNGIQTQYAYDSDDELKQLTFVNSGGTTIGTVAYGYDANGRRVSVSGSLASVSIPAAVSSATYDVNNRISSWLGKSYSYDNNGNLTADGVNTYSWNARDQLTAAAGATFTYDGLSRRSSKTVGGNTTNFLFDGNNFVQEIAASGAVANDLAGAMDELFARTTGSTSISMLTDGLGSVIAETNSSQAISTSYAYEPYGATSIVTGVASTSQQYTGRENDSTGLYYNRMRYYSPATARFISEDPMDWGSGQANNYTYVSQNPVSFIDPLGLMGHSGGPGCTRHNNNKCIHDWLNDEYGKFLGNDIIPAFALGSYLGVGGDSSLAWEGLGGAIALKGGIIVGLGGTGFYLLPYFPAIGTGLINTAIYAPDVLGVASAALGGFATMAQILAAMHCNYGFDF